MNNPENIPQNGCHAGEPPVPHYGIRDKLRFVINEARADSKMTGKLGKVTLAATVAMIGYEWGYGNETATPIIAGRSIDGVDDPAGIARGALIVGGFTLGQQLLSGRLARSSIEHFPQTASSINTLIPKPSEGEKFKGFTNLSQLRKAYYSIFLGSSFNVFREAFAAKETDQDKLTNVSRKSSFISSGAVAGLAGAAGAVEAYVDNAYAETALTVAKNPLPWLGIGGLVIANDVYQSRKRRRKRQSEPA